MQPNSWSPPPPAGQSGCLHALLFAIACAWVVVVTIVAQSAAWFYDQFQLLQGVTTPGWFWVAAALHQALASGAQTIQACFNLINPSAGISAPPNFPFQDYQQLIDRAAERGLGVIAIRVLAAGALSGSADRHPNAAQSVEPIATGSSFAADVAWARRFDALVAEGYASSLVEVAIRFVVGKPEVATTLVGISSIEQFDQALAAVNQGALLHEASARLQTIWQAT